MCTGSTEWFPPPTLDSSTRKQGSKRPKVRVHRLNRRKRRSCEEKVGEDIELKNLKLYMENMSILQENQKLRMKATLLHQENLALMSELHNKLSHHSNSVSSTTTTTTTLFLLPKH
ncbi:protein LITTLE ZIPPER 2-like [Cornus florida]|uniref:protein LITTLE ZIPPER 2-like n=1 Tax=Cornus florida TaxID=4283 RepID=UPI00289C6963|nr:protein LITTLE ZIPPER 2-like [Cornus florida]